jgi:hypothetical protein
MAIEGAYAGASRAIVCPMLLAELERAIRRPRMRRLGCRKRSPVSPSVGREIPPLGHRGNTGDPASRDQSYGVRRRIVDPVTKEDFLCAA